MKTPGIYVSGLGAVIPGIMDARDAVELGLYDPEDYEWFGWTGAAVAGDTPAPDLAVRAARQAVQRSGHSGADIDVHLHAYSWAQGPIGWSPHHYILRHITDRDVPSLLFWQACSGVVGSLEVAASYLMAVQERRVAVVTGADNVGVPNFNRWAFGLQNGVIGDGASAVVLSKNGGFARLLSIRSGSTSDLEHLYRGNEPVFPPSHDNSRQVDFRERMASFGDDTDTSVEKVISRQGELRAELALSALAEAGLGPGDVSRVTHVFTGQESYLKVILDPMGLRPEQGLLEFGRQFGHMTVNDQIVGLEHLVVTRQVGPGDNVLMVAHGGGTSITCAVVRILHQPDWADGRATTPPPVAPSTPAPHVNRVRLTPPHSRGGAR
ncbi:3-oxoacyl-[acyl-carrier-protein] synthase-3 [Saccharothrix saharensis]|uniref:3-oxoacyl-[acyl-carrier-protein] synthase-3 n=1 Tax=Saccharothrix saharensis TaxID=571190 RepID=A0A543J986_9PSEU|nr:ketoacyl-ACP synthase III family protein [Saccharothrix saharensis]TQM79392.1 3-oxoacyl-[acyl-carrier-protein] synthase-3 [Saccharothrix saharensis]